MFGSEMSFEDTGSSQSRFNGPKPQRDPELEARRQSLLASLRESVQDEAVISAISRVPREAFVPPDLRDAAYDNRALPIGYGQTISQPLIIAVMTAALKPRSTDRILEVGTGSGYQAAILSRLAAHVITVERVPELVETATKRLEILGFNNITVQQADDQLGWEPGAPYDGILVAAGSPRVPQPLVNQLTENARLVIPVGPASHQSLLVITRTRTGQVTRDLGGCQFVPLIGPEAWDNQD